MDQSAIASGQEIITCGDVIWVLQAAAAVVVELPQMPEYDRQTRWSCAWKVDELLVMSMVGLVEEGGLVLVSMREMWEHFLSVRLEDSGDSRSHCFPGAQLWVGLSHNWLVFFERP